MDQVNTLINSAHLFIEIVGFIVLIFKGGEHIGKVTQILTNQQKTQEEMKTLQSEHIKEDKNSFSIVFNELSDLRVRVAANGKRLDN